MDHRKFLEEALKDAYKAKEEGQIPIGAVIVNGKGEIIARGYNQVKKLNKRTAHAEMLVIDEALSKFDGEDAVNWTIYSTLEPCPMCLGTIIMAHIGSAVWAAPDTNINTHTMLEIHPYLRKQNLVVIKTPFSDLENICSKLNYDYWMSNGREDVVNPSLNNFNKENM